MHISPWHCCSCPFLPVMGFSFSWWHFFPFNQQYICIGRLVGLPHYLLRGFVSNFFICMDFWILFHYPGGHLIFLGNCWLSWAQSICPRPNMRNAKGLYQEATLPSHHCVPQPPEGRGQCAAPWTSTLKTIVIHLNSSFPSLSSYARQSATLWELKIKRWPLPSRSR